MTISAEQIRGARAIMNWSQDVMAQECGLSLTTIHNLEKGFKSTRSSEEIRKKLEDKGFEFFGRKGISLREDTHRTYEGRDGCQKFCENLLSTAKQNGGEIIAVFRVCLALAARAVTCFRQSFLTIISTLFLKCSQYAALFYAHSIGNGLARKFTKILHRICKTQKIIKKPGVIYKKSTKIAISSRA